MKRDEVSSPSCQVAPCPLPYSITVSSSVLTCIQHVDPSLEGSVSSIADLASGVSPETLHIIASMGIKSLLIPVADLQIFGE